MSELPFRVNSLLEYCDADRWFPSYVGTKLLVIDVKHIGPHKSICCFVTKTGVCAYFDEDELRTFHVICY